MAEEGWSHQGFGDDMLLQALTVSPGCAPKDASYLGWRAEAGNEANSNVR